VDHLEVICNGKVARDLKLTGNRDAAKVGGVLSISTSGWCLLRASNDQAVYPVLDMYPYATTSPIYVSVEGSKIEAKEDAEYFLAWIDRLVAGVQANGHWNNELEKAAVLDQLAQARRVYEERLH